MRDKKRIKRKIRGTLIVLLSVLCMLGYGETAWASQLENTEASQQPVVMTRQLSREEADHFSEPPSTWKDEKGGEYRLEDWEIAEIPGKQVKRQAERRVRYEGVEGAETLPASILVREEQSGQQAQGELDLKERIVLSEWWDNSFHVPVTFYAYGAREYQLGSLRIKDEEAGRADIWGQELLMQLGLPAESYRLSSLEWAGEAYMDESGQVCRQAEARGEKLLRNYEAVYEGEISWQEPSVYELTAEYVPAAKEGAAGETAPSLEQQKTEEQEDPLWYWVRGGFVLAVAAGLFGIVLGLALLLFLRLRQRKREKEAGRLPMIDK